MKRFSQACGAAILAVPLVMLAACSTSPDPEGAKSDTSYVEVDTPHGPVICVVYDSGNYAGGLSCDWSQAPVAP